MGPCSLSSKGGALFMSSEDGVLFDQLKRWGLVYEFRRWGLVRSVQKMGPSSLISKGHDCRRHRRERSRIQKASREFRCCL